MIFAFTAWGQADTRDHTDAVRGDVVWVVKGFVEAPDDPTAHNEINDFLLNMGCGLWDGIDLMSKPHREAP